MVIIDAETEAPQNVIIPFPHAQCALHDAARCRSRVSLPFSEDEIAIIALHLCDREPELTQGICERDKAELIDRFLGFLWKWWGPVTVFSALAIHLTQCVRPEIS